MKSTQPAISNDDMTSFDLGEVVFTDTHASQLSEAELTDVIGLLLEAHYQSSPNDLRLLLDDPHQQLLLAHHEKILTGVDRKSTRLNSSHVRISYAVFCLKKKKNKKIL